MYFFLKNKSNSGFTLIEIIITLGIISLISTALYASFASSNRRQVLEKQTASILALLEDAHSETLSSKNLYQYGVHLDADQAVLFRGSAYSALDASNQVQPLDNRVTISDISLAGGGSDVLFDRLTGATSNSGSLTVTLAADNSQTKTITIFKTGLIESN